MRSIKKKSETAIKHAKNEEYRGFIRVSRELLASGDFDSAEKELNRVDDQASVDVSKEKLEVAIQISKAQQLEEEKLKVQAEAEALRIQQAEEAARKSVEAAAQQAKEAAAALAKK